MKVDLELLKKARDIQHETGGRFCQDCGETKPESGFYPMSMSSNWSLSPYLCNDCEYKRRRAVALI